VAVLAAYALGYNVIHLLGAYANPRYELKQLLRFGFVRGVDSSYPTVYTQHGLVLDDDSFSLPRPKRDIDFLNDYYNEGLLTRNIATWLRACTPNEQ
jgi:hypothetical protein